MTKINATEAAHLAGIHYKTFARLCQRNEVKGSCQPAGKGGHYSIDLTTFTRALLFGHLKGYRKYETVIPIDHPKEEQQTLYSFDAYRKKEPPKLQSEIIDDIILEEPTRKDPTVYAAEMMEKHGRECFKTPQQYMGGHAKDWAETEKAGILPEPEPEPEEKTNEVNIHLEGADFFGDPLNVEAMAKVIKEEVKDAEGLGLEVKKKRPENWIDLPSGLEVEKILGPNYGETPEKYIPYSRRVMREEIEELKNKLKAEEAKKENWAFLAWLVMAVFLIGVIGMVMH